MVSIDASSSRREPAVRSDEQLRLKAEARALDFYYGDFKALKGIKMPIYQNKVTALIGPSGCGKSTFLRCFNRMHDLYPNMRYDGEIRLLPDDVNILAPALLASFPPPP